MGDLTRVFVLLTWIFILILIIQAVELTADDVVSATPKHHAHHDNHHRPDTLPHIEKIRRCGGHKHASMTRPCALNDTDCGAWSMKDRYWHPLSCKYQDISSEEARKCLGNRTLAFIGDSQIRDIAVGVAMFLLGQTLMDAPDHKFDYKGDLELNGTRVPDFPDWKNVVGHNKNGYIFPQREVAAAKGYTWQVQIWNLFRNEFIHNQVDQVLNNSMPARFPLLRPIDLAFWAHGLHDYGWFNTPPYGERFFSQMPTMWLNTRKKYPVPSIWVSMNPECRPLIQYKLSNMDLQALMVEELNWYTNKRMLEEKLPYWDAGAVLRSPQRCNVSDDGVHVKMYVDIMRAKMLFNHLCDGEMNWRGSPNMFI